MSENRILQKTVELGLIALVIIFQPELRRLLERMGSKALPRFGAMPLETLGMDNVISQTIAACTQLSATKTGALIVFERSVTLDEQMRSGTIINSDVTIHDVRKPDRGHQHRQLCPEGCKLCHKHFLGCSFPFCRCKTPIL